jgi:hypothetical protein
MVDRHLHERWIDDTVPEDVSDLDGHYRFALTESTAWLSFKTTEARLSRSRDTPNGISTEISFQDPFNRAGGPTSNVRKKRCNVELKWR